MKDWEDMVQRILHLSKTVTIAIVGKYVALHDAYLSVREALFHGGYANDAKVEIAWIDGEEITPDNVEGDTERRRWYSRSQGLRRPWNRGEDSGMSVCAGHDIPYLGICLGMQVTVIEFAKRCLQYGRCRQPGSLSPTANIWLSI